MTNYNEELHNASKIAYSKNKISVKKEKTDKENEKINKLETKLIKILAKRFHEEASKNTKLPDMLHIRINKPFYKEADPGYKEITELLHCDGFTSFTNKYLIYLTGTRFVCDEYGGAFYDLAWDYKRYYLMNLPIRYTNQFIEGITNFTEDIRNLGL